MDNQLLSTRDVIRILTTAMEGFRDGIDPEAPAQRILTLLAIAAHPDMPQADMERHVAGISPAAASRNIMDLSAVNRKREKGPDLVTQVADPMYRRRNLLRTTVRGDRLLEEMTRKINHTLSALRKPV